MSTLGYGVRYRIHELPNGVTIKQVVAHPVRNEPIGKCHVSRDGYYCFSTESLEDALRIAAERFHGSQS